MSPNGTSIISCGTTWLCGDDAKAAQVTVHCCPVPCLLHLQSLLPAHDHEGCTFRPSWLLAASRCIPTAGLNVPDLQHVSVKLDNSERLDTPHDHHKAVCMQTVVAVPLGLSTAGLPVGGNFAGPLGSDGTILSLGLAVENVR